MSSPTEMITCPGCEIEYNRRDTHCVNCGTPLTWPKLRRGLAAMSPERRREIASKGGIAAHARGVAYKWTTETARKAGSIGGTMSRGGRGKLITAILTTLLTPTVLWAQEQCYTPYPGGVEICSDPGPKSPPPSFECPTGTLFNPYVSDSSDTCQAPYRSVPAPERGNVFGHVREQGPPANLETLGLRRSDMPDSLLWYQRSTGAAWLVLHDQFAPDCILETELAPNLNLIAIDMDKDGNDDLLGHDVRSGLVHRFYTRALAGCRR